jgi:ribosomal protein S18 acetylase RimI-like enzyme
MRHRSDRWEIRPWSAGADPEAVGLLRAFYGHVSWKGGERPEGTMLGRALQDAVSPAGLVTPVTPALLPVVLAACGPGDRLLGVIAARWDPPAQTDVTGGALGQVTFVPWSPAVDPLLAAVDQEEVALALIHRVLATGGAHGRPELPEPASAAPEARYIIRFTPADHLLARQIIAWYATAGFSLTGERFVLSKVLDCRHASAGREEPAPDTPPAPARVSEKGRPGPGDWVFRPIDPTEPLGLSRAASLLQRAHEGGSDPDGRELAASAEACRRWLEAALAGRRGGTYADGLWLVAADPAGHEAGFAFLLDRDPADLHVADLGVLPEFRRRGLGTALLQVAADIARRRGRSSLTLYVSAGNQAALQLYDRAGFRKTTTICAMQWSQPPAGSTVGRGRKPA